MAPLAGFSQSAGFGGIQAATGWNFTDTGDKLDVTNTGHNGKQHLIPGVQRAKGSITVVVDDDETYTNWAFGAKGTAFFGTDVQSTMEAMVVSCGQVSAVNGIVSATLEIEQDGDVVTP